MSTNTVRPTAVGDGLPSGLGTEPDTAKFTWRDLPAWQTYGSSEGMSSSVRHPSDLPWAAIREEVEVSATGGLLMWNKSQDAEGGHLMMFAGQTAGQERITLSNATWWISCGLVYAEGRCGKHFLLPDERVQIKHDAWHVWYLPNDQSVVPTHLR